MFIKQCHVRSVLLALYRRKSPLLYIDIASVLTCIIFFCLALDAVKLPSKV